MHLREHTTNARWRDTLSVGWREWLSLPDLNIPAIKAKVDTGAKTSALHAFRMETFRKEDGEYIRFWIHPLRRKKDIQIVCEAKITDRRMVKDSGGHAEERYVIRTPVVAGDRRWPIEITLTSREDMMFRMLLGRSALSEGGFIVDPETSFVLGRGLRRSYRRRARKDRNSV